MSKRSLSALVRDINKRLPEEERLGVFTRKRGLRRRGAAAVVMSRADAEALVSAAEDAEDIRLARGAEVETPARDRWPVDLVKRELRGESPIRLWREHRGLSVTALAEKAGFSQSYLSEIETGRKQASARALKALAEALDVGLDDLV